MCYALLFRECKSEQIVLDAFVTRTVAVGGGSTCSLLVARNDDTIGTVG